MPKVSVCIPSFNHEKYIAETIKSVLNQTFEDFELIITDDGSSDKTVEVIKSFKDPRIKLYIFDENLGAAEAYGNCISNAVGEYIANLSSDDVFFPEKLEKQVEYLDNHANIAAVFTHVQIIDENGNDFKEEKHFYYSVFDQPNRTRFEWLNYFFYNGNCLCHPSVLIRRECYAPLVLQEKRFAQLGDFNYWVKICLKYDIHIIQEKLTRFRVQKNSLNASGLRPDVLKRYSIERIEIQKTFLEIQDIKEFKKVFPQYAEEKINKGCIPYYLAIEALNSSRERQIFSFDTLFDLMKKKAKLLKKELNFGYKEFLKLTGEYDIFNQCNGWQATLFIDTGKGFNDNQRIAKEINLLTKNFNISYNLEQYKMIKQIRFDPLENNYCSLKINEITVKKLGCFNKFSLFDISSDILTNGKKLDNGSIEFDTLDPQVILLISGEIEQITISGEIQLYNLINRIFEILKEKHQVIYQNEQVIKQNEQDLHSLYSSYTWRIGRIFTWLPGKLLKGFNKVFKK